MKVHRWTDKQTGKVYDFPTEDVLHVFGLYVESLTEHIKRFHSLLIQQSVEVGTPRSEFIRPHNRTKDQTMSLEQKIEELTSAVHALTEQLRGTTKHVTPVGKDNEVAPTPAPKAEKPTKAEKPAKPAEPEITIEELKTLAQKVKAAHSLEVAKGLIKKVGKAEKTDDVEPANRKALKEALEAKLEEEAGDEDEGM